MARIQVGLAALAVLATGCSETPLHPAKVAAIDAVAATELVQVLEASTSVDGGDGHFEIRSVLQNAGEAPATVWVRSCYLRDADLRGNGDGLSVAEPLMLCADGARQITLLPGEASEPVTIEGRGVPGATYTLELRHMVRPERWATLTLRIE